MSMLSVGVTGLNAAQLGMITADHNISNANTEGFNRQRTVQAANIPLATGSGFIGQGTRVDTVQRMYNGFVAGQVAQSSTRASELKIYQSEIGLIDNMLADPSSGLSPALQDFFAGVQQVAADPSSLSSRQSMVSSSEALISRFGAMEQRLGEQYASVNEQLASHVGVINSFADQIANYNKQIVLSEAGTGKSANDLLDQRDQLVAELNKEIKVTVVTDSNGNFNVFVGSGQQLVVGATANQLLAAPSTADGERYTISLVSGTNSQELPESVISGGALGGLIRFRSESLDVAANSLGRAAASIALTFNAQHALGQDLLGNIAGAAGFVSEYFQLGAPKIVANSLNAGPTDLTAKFIQPPPMQFNNGDFSVTYDAAASAYRVTSQKYGIDPGDIPPGDLQTVLAAASLLVGTPIDTTSGNFKTDLTISDYRVQIDDTGLTFSVTRLSDNFLVVPSGTGVFGAAVQVDGLEINVASGVASDTFVIQPTREIARNLSLNNGISADPRLIAAGGPVRSAVGVTNAGSAKIEVSALSSGYSAPANGAPINIAYSAGNLTFSVAPPATIGSIFFTPSGATPQPVLTGVIPYTPDAVVTINGISLKLSGVPKEGDSFTVARNTNAVADSRNALLLGKLQTQNTMAGGTASYQGAYAQLVSVVGNKAREIEVTGAAQESLLEQAQAAREAASGVNLDEEAANLIRYQQAYQAAARVIDVGQKLFDVLVSLGR